MDLQRLFLNRTEFSFEVFPPKTDKGIPKFRENLKSLVDMQPDYVSITMGAGGSAYSVNTLDGAAYLQNELNCNAVVHLPCVHMTKEDVRQILREMKAKQLTTILALSGDVKEGVKPSEDFEHASDLMAFIREEDDSFRFLAACYPEVHPSAPSMQHDIQYLKLKAELGAEAFVSQLFLSNDAFYSFREAYDLAGLTQPISCGIMPITRPERLTKTLSLSEDTTSIPKVFLDVLDKYGDDPIAFREAGIDLAIQQIRDLVEQEVDGIHLYTMNQPDVTQAIYEGIKDLIKPLEPFVEA